jgi:DNA repair protein RadA/Sms
VAAALVSCVSAKPLPARAVFFGEVALSAELRQVPQAETRLKEAAKLGFELGFMPKFSKKIRPPSGISTTQPDNLSDFIDLLSGRRS